MKTYKLLSHKWQLPGWSLAFIGLLLVLLTFLQGYDLYQIGLCIFELGFILLAFTEEKDEDERVKSIRLKCIAITAIIYVAMWLLRPLLLTIVVRFLPFETYRILSNAMALLNMIPMYVLIFKGTIYIQNKQLSYDK